MKKVISLILVVIMMFGVIPVTELGVTASAVTFNQLNDTSVFLKQQESKTCTLCAAAMMMRRYSMLRGDSGWNSITESSIKSAAWLTGAGLYNSFSYSNNSVSTIKVANYSLPRNSSNASVIIEELKKCPEGIVLYNGNAPHAILLTDYTDGVFYCADPANGVSAGRIPISQAYKVTINNATSYWKVTSPIVDGPTDDHNCSYHININWNTENGKFYDSNTATVTVTPKIDGRDAYDSEINSIYIGVKYPNGKVLYKDMGKNRVLKNFYIGNGDAGDYIFWAEIGTIYGSVNGSATDGSVSVNLTRLSWADRCYDTDVVYRRIAFEDIDRYMTVTSDGNVASYKRQDNNSSNQAQIWKLIKNSDISYTIQSVQNNKVLDAEDAKASRGTNVMTFGSHGGDNQKWYLCKDNNGNWFIRLSKSNSAVLDVEDANTAEGTNIGLWTYNGGSPQKISFEYPYRVVYNANGGSGAPSTQYRDFNETISLSSTKPTRDGYIFLGWSTSSTATSASYNPGSSYSTNADLNLYAVWKKNPNYTLSYNANGGSGAPSSQTGAASYTISSTEPTRTGYTFRGWSKSSSASTVSYRPDDTIDISSNTTLYAVWKKSFYGDVDNDGVITSSDLMLLNKLLRGISVDSLNTLKGDLDGDEELSDNDLSLLAKFYQMKTDTFPVENKFYAFTICDTPDKTEYKSGEKINTDGLSVAIVYRDANYHIVNEGLTISPEYASGSGKQTITVTLGDWSTDFTITVEDTTAYTLSYNANGGSGAPSSQTGAKSYTVSSTVPTRKGYTFLGWSKDSSATTASYKPNDSITISSNITLYAVWKAASSISSGKEYTTTIDFASQEYYYTFTPSSSGNYTFESTGSLDTKVYVYSSSWSELGVNDDAGTDSNFKLNLNLTSGNKYYVKVRAYGSKVGTTKFSVVKDHTHSYTSSVTTQATCKNEGVKTYKCSCGASYTESIAKKDHTIVSDKSVDATCTKTGLTEGKHCSVCNTVTVAQKTVAKKEHKDSNGDGKCDSCKKQLSADKPEASKCYCNCHGSGISKLFFKISLIFKRIFGLDRTCSCGVNHY